MEEKTGFSNVIVQMAVRSEIRGRRGDIQFRWSFALGWERWLGHGIVNGRYSEVVSRLGWGITHDGHGGSRGDLWC